MDHTKNVIYILTNPAFPEYIKIGYATDLNQRLKSLNDKSCLPFSFRVYATYEVDVKLADKQVHSIIDRLRPELRAVEENDSHTRKREFYMMSPEDAYGILEAIAEIHDRADCLKKWNRTEKEKKEEEFAQENRRSNFSFFACGIQKGEVVQFCDDKSISCVVASDRKVEHDGELYSLSALAQKLTGRSPLQGPTYFEYKGERLTDLRNRLGL